MKRIFYLLIALGAVSFSQAQTIVEGLKISGYDLNGSARYMGTAGAFGALGGDVSAIKDNPAGLGVFRKSELTGSLGLRLQNSSATWGGLKSTDDYYSPTLNNMHLIFAGKTWREESGFSGLVGSNFAFSYEKLTNFDRNTSISGKNMTQSITDYYANFTGKTAPANIDYDANRNVFNNSNVGWLPIMAYYGGLIKPIYNSNNQLTEWVSLLEAGEKVSPNYRLQESGDVNSYSLGWSGNFSNRVFVGATVNLLSVNYESLSTYKESFENGGNFSLSNALVNTGFGANLNLGIIAVPLDFLRIGASIHLPTTYQMELLNYSQINFNTTMDGNLKTPTNNVVNYRLQSPMQLHVSGAFMLNNKGFLSMEYVYSNYTGMKFMDENGNSTSYDTENTSVKNYLNKNARTLKIGAEYKLTDNIAIRAGHAIMNNTTNPNFNKFMYSNSARSDAEFFVHKNTSYFSTGIGYRENNWYIDFSYALNLINEDFVANDATNITNTALIVPTAQVKHNYNSFVTTIGMRF